MDQVTLALPEAILEVLPPESEETALDMERAVEGWQRRINRALSEEDDATGVVDAVERFEDRMERYDDYVVELRSWGQSPIYAMAWRDLYAALVSQLYEHDDLADRIDRERHARLVEDGIRFDG